MYTTDYTRKILDAIDHLDKTYEEVLSLFPAETAPKKGMEELSLSIILQDKNVLVHHRQEDLNILRTLIHRIMIDSIK
jgi:hypothetical protein